MSIRADELAKEILRAALSRAAFPQTEVEVAGATQSIDVYSVPDPSRAAERSEMGMIGELSAEPCLIEPFSSTPRLGFVRRCINKQLAWHHELERRARSEPRAGEGASERDEGDEGDLSPPLPFPKLVIVSPGRPDTVLDAYGCREIGPGLYDAVWGLAMRVVVLSELPRTRKTLLLRLLGKERILAEALADLNALPPGSWEQSVASPVLIHFNVRMGDAHEQEEDVSAEIQAWYDEYQKRQQEDKDRAVNEARTEALRGALTQLLTARFGEPPLLVTTRLEGAVASELESWIGRFANARALADVFEDRH